MNHEYFFTSIVTFEEDETKFIKKMIQSFVQESQRKAFEKSYSIKGKLNKNC